MEDKPDILSKLQEIRGKPYDIIVYSAVLILVALPMVFAGLELCMINIAIAVLGVLIPIKLFGEWNVKKIAIAGIVGIIIIGAIGTVFTLNLIYTQEHEILESDNLHEGSIDSLYGKAGDSFTFSIRVGEEVDIEEIMVNLTRQDPEDLRTEITESYTMEPVEDEDHIYTLTHVIDEDEIYMHYFSMRFNDTTEIRWEETESGFGPTTIQRSTAALFIMAQRSLSPVVSFLLIVGIFWWWKRMQKSRKVGEEELEAKEKALDNYCEFCGKLLEEGEECPDCPTDDSKEERKRCEKCGKIYFSEGDYCPYCGEFHGED